MEGEGRGREGGIVTVPPRAPGTYVLFLRLAGRDDVELGVGRLGRVAFPAGLYAYVGSARGPGGLAARLARHLRPDKPLHWHIDHLTAVARITEVWCMVGDAHRECTWATALDTWSGAQVVAPGFGASDCRCRTHLFRLVAQPPRAIIPDSIACTAYTTWSAAGDRVKRFGV